MSRHIHTIPEGHLAFGLDHMSGYFLQVFNYKGDLVKEFESDPFFKDDVRTPRNKIAEYLIHAGADDDLIDCIILDLPI